VNMQNPSIGRNNGRTFPEGSDARSRSAKLNRSKERFN
jgi:hypothetical protein